MREYFYLQNKSDLQTQQVDDIKVTAIEEKPARWVKAIVWFTLSCFIGQPVLSLAQSIGPKLEVERNIGVTAVSSGSAGASGGPVVCGNGSPICGASSNDPTVTTTNQGRPLVNINAANPNGVSYNRYYQFNVYEIGAVLNNNNGGVERSKIAIAPGSTGTGGFVRDEAEYNPRLGTSTAKLIINEVTSTNQSQLKGALTVAGPAADVIVANPNGITCDGCGFINTNRGVLTTGTPTLNSQGQLSSIAVAQGRITIGEKGLVDYQTPQIDLIAGNVSVAGQIQNQVGGQAGQANGVGGAVGKLNIIAGQNNVTLRNGTSTAYQIDGTSDLSVQVTIPTIAPGTGIDVSGLGGMYAEQIRLVSTNNGVGVNSAGTIYSVGDIKIESDGNLHLSASRANQDGSTNYGVVDSGYYQKLAQTGASDPRGSGGITITGAAKASDGSFKQAGAIDNTSGTLRAHGGPININAASLDNTQGNIIANGSGDVNITTAGALVNKGDGSSLQANAGSVTLNASGIDNSVGGKIFAQDSVDIVTGAGGINNSGTSTRDGGLISADRWVTLASDQGALNNSNKGRVQAKNAGLIADMTSINNSQTGSLRSGSNVDLNASTGDIDNRSGGIINAGVQTGLSARSGRVLNSSGGKVLAQAGALSIAAQSIDNSQGGTIRAVGALNLRATAGNINNSQGGVVDSSGQVSLRASGDLLNAAGSVQSRGGMDIDTANVDNSAGLIQDIDKGDITINTGNLSNLKGTYTNQNNQTSDGGVISSYGGSLSIAATNLTNSGLINSGSATSAAFMSLSGIFNNTGVIQGANDLWMDFQDSASQTNAGTISSKGYLVVQNASSFLNTGSADSNGNCGGLCAGKSLFFTGGTLVNKGMIRAQKNVYLGVDTDGNKPGLTRLDNQYGAALIGVDGSVFAKVVGSDLTSGSNAQAVDPQVKANALAAQTAADVAKTAADSALTNVQDLRGSLVGISIAETALHDLQGASLVNLLAKADTYGKQLQADGTTLDQKARDASLGNANLTTNSTTIAATANSAGSSTVTLTANANTALTDANNFFGWTSGLLNGTLNGMTATSKLSDYVAAITALKSDPRLDTQYPPITYMQGSANDPRVKLQNLISTLTALDQANQATFAHATTATNLVASVDAEIGIKQSAVEQAVLVKGNADNAVIAIIGPEANNQALVTAQSDVQAKQAAVDSIVASNSGLVVAAANAQRDLTVANANKIDADKALTNAQNLSDGINRVISLGSSLSNVSGASLTDKVIASQDLSSALLQAATSMDFAGGDSSVSAGSLKTNAATVSKNALAHAATSASAANALAALLNKSFDLDSSPANKAVVTNLQNTNKAANNVSGGATALFNNYKNSSSPSDTMKKTLAAIAAIQSAAGNLATAADDPPPPASASAPADPPLTATQRASATRSATDALYQAAADLETAINSGGLAFVLEIGGGNVGNGVGKLIEFTSVINAARNSANQSASARSALVTAMDTAFAQTPGNKKYIDDMNNANAATASDSAAASQLVGGASAEINTKKAGVAQAVTAQTNAQNVVRNANQAVDNIQASLVSANNNLVSSVVELSKVSGASELVSNQVALNNEGTIYGGMDVTLAAEPTQGKLATIRNKSHQDQFGNEDGGLIQAGRSMSLGRDCGLDSNGNCTKDVWTNAAGGVTVNNTARIKTTGTKADGTAWNTGGDINIQADVFHNSIADPGVTTDVGARTRTYQGDSGRYASGVDPYVHHGTHGGYVMGVTPSWNTSVDTSQAITNTALYSSAMTTSSLALATAIGLCASPIGFASCFAIPGLSAAASAAQLSYTGAFYQDFNERWSSTQHFNTPLSKARPNIVASHDLVIREKNGTNIGGTLAAGNNVIIKPIDGQPNSGSFINKALVLQKFDYTLDGRRESRCGPGDELCTSGPTQVLGDTYGTLGAPVTTTRVINGVSQSYGGVIQALNGTAGITVGTLINLGATDDKGNVPDLGKSGLSIAASTQNNTDTLTKGGAAVNAASLGATTAVLKSAGGTFAEITLPTGNNGVFIKAQPNSPYLVVSNPLYGAASTALGIDTLYRDYYGPKMAADAFQEKLIGDARYQAQLISDQVLAQTGLASLGSSVYGPDMLAELTNNAFEESSKAALARSSIKTVTLGTSTVANSSPPASAFVVGQELTSEQQAALTKDIVWMVSEVIGGQSVLVPKLYLSSATKAKIEGGQILGKDVDIKVTQLYNVGGNIQATGTADDGTGGNVNIKATGGVTNISGNIKGETVELDAKTLYLGTTVSRAGNEDNYADTAGKVGTIEGGKGGVTVTTTNDTNIFGGQIKSVGGDVSVTSREGNVNVKSLVLEKKTTETSAAGDLFTHESHSDVTTTQSALTAGISATKSADGSGGDVALSGKTGINLTGAAIKGEGNVSLDSTDGSVNDRALYLTSTRQTKDSQTGGRAENTPTTFSYSYGTDTTTTDERDKQGVGSSIQAGNQLSISAKNIISEGGVYSGKTGDIQTKGEGVIAFNAIKNEYSKTTTKTSDRAVFSGSVDGAVNKALTDKEKKKQKPASLNDKKTAAPDEVASMKAGYGRETSTQEVNATTYDNALLAFSNGINIKADNKDTVAGSGNSVIDLGSLDAYSNGDITMQAGRVISTKNENTYSEKNSSSSTFVGANADLHSSLMTAIKEGQAGNDASGAGVATLAKGMGGVSAGVGFEHNAKESTYTATAENIAHISGGNVSIKTSQGNMTLAGVDLSATGQTYQQDTTNKFVAGKNGYKLDPATGNILNPQGKVVKDKDGYLIGTDGNRLLQGGNLSLQASTGDVDIIAARNTSSFTSSQTSVGMNVGVSADFNPAAMALSAILPPGVGDLILSAATGGQTASFHAGGDKGKGSDVSHTDSQLNAAGKLTIQSSKRDVNLTGVTAVGGDVAISAGHSLNNNAYQDSSSYEQSSTYVGASSTLSGGPPIGILSKNSNGNSTHEAGNTIYALGSQTVDTKGVKQHVDGNLTMTATTGDIKLHGGDYYGDNATITASQGNINIIAAKDTATDHSEQGGAQITMGASASFADFGGGVSYGSLDGGKAEYKIPDALKEKEKEPEKEPDAVGMKGKKESVGATTQNQLNKEAALKAGGFGVNVYEGSDVTLSSNAFTNTGMDTLRDTSAITQKGAGHTFDGARSKVSGELLAANAGVGIDYKSSDTNDVVYQNAQINVGKKLNIEAKQGSVDIGGVDIGNVDPFNNTHAGTTVLISGEEIKTTKYTDVHESKTVDNSAFVGVKAEAHSAIADAAAHVTTHIVNGVKNKEVAGKDGTAASASSYAKGRLAAQTIAEVAVDAVNIVTGDLVGASANLAITDSHSEEYSKQTRENINTIKGGNITLQSTKRDINLKGVKIAADEDTGSVTLDSARSLNISAAKSTNEGWSSTNSAGIQGGGNVGVNLLTLIATGEVGPGGSVSADFSHQESKTNEVSWKNSSITGANVTVKSKNDTNLNGAVIKGGDVALDVGGNLNVTSVQDTKDNSGWSMNLNGNVGASFDAYTLVAPSGGGGGGGGANWDRSARVAEQSGISASKSLKGTVAGDLNLAGAYLEDTSGGSTLGVGGTVHATEIHDFEDKDGFTANANLSISPSKSTSSSSKAGTAARSAGKSFGGGTIGYTSDTSIKYDAMQKATVAGIDLKKIRVDQTLSGNADKGTDGNIKTYDVNGSVAVVGKLNTDGANKIDVKQDDYNRAFDSAVQIPGYMEFKKKPPTEDTPPSKKIIPPESERPVVDHDPGEDPQPPHRDPLPPIVQDPPIVPPGLKQDPSEKKIPGSDPKEIPIKSKIDETSPTNEKKTYDPSSKDKLPDGARYIADQETRNRQKDLNEALNGIKIGDTANDPKAREQYYKDINASLANKPMEVWVKGTPEEQAAAGQKLRRDPDTNQPIDGPVKITIDSFDKLMNLDGRELVGTHDDMPGLNGKEWGDQPLSYEVRRGSDGEFKINYRTTGGDPSNDSVKNPRNVDSPLYAKGGTVEGTVDPSKVAKSGDEIQKQRADRIAQLAAEEKARKTTGLDAEAADWLARKKDASDSLQATKDIRNAKQELAEFIRQKGGLNADGELSRIADKKELNQLRDKVAAAEARQQAVEDRVALKDTTIDLRGLAGAVDAKDKKYSAEDLANMTLDQVKKLGPLTRETADGKKENITLDVQKGADGKFKVVSDHATEGSKQESLSILGTDFILTPEMKNSLPDAQADQFDPLKVLSGKDKGETIYYALAKNANGETVTVHTDAQGNRVKKVEAQTEPGPTKTTLTIGKNADGSDSNYIIKFADGTEHDSRTQGAYSDDAKRLEGATINYPDAKNQLKPGMQTSIEIDATTGLVKESSLVVPSSSSGETKYKLDVENKGLQDYSRAEVEEMIRNKTLTSDGRSIISDGTHPDGQPAFHLEKTLPNTGRDASLNVKTNHPEGGTSTIAVDGKMLPDDAVQNGSVSIPLDKNGKPVKEIMVTNYGPADKDGNRKEISITRLVRDEATGKYVIPDDGHTELAAPKIIEERGTPGAKIEGVYTILDQQGQPIKKIVGNPSHLLADQIEKVNQVLRKIGLLSTPGSMTVDIEKGFTATERASLKKMIAADPNGRVILVGQDGGKVWLKLSNKSGKEELVVQHAQPE